MTTNVLLTAEPIHEKRQIPAPSRRRSFKTEVIIVESNRIETRSKCVLDLLIS